MIQEIKDEVLAGEPLYVIEGSDGTVLQDNVKITRKTPVVEEATELNRATLGNMQGDLYTVDRYNKTTVTDGIEYRMMPTEGNIFPTEWEDVSTGTKDIFKANGITISAPEHNYTNANDAQATLNNAFDNYVGSSAGSGYKIKTSTSPVEILIDFDTPTKITKTKISFGVGSTNSSLISNVYIKGSKNNSDWFTLATYTGSQTSAFTYHETTLSNPDYYSTYKIEYVLAGSDEVRVNLEEFQTTEYYSLQPTTVYTHNLSLPLTSYEVGKIVNIEGQSIDVYRDDTIQTTNIFPTSDWTEVTEKTKYTSGGYTIESSSSEMGYFVYDACDGVNGTYWQSRQGTEHWIKMTCPNPQKITKMLTRITASNNTSRFSKAVIQGSKDDIAWVDLHTISSYQTTLTEVTLENTDYYKYYRVLINLNLNVANVGALVSEWQVSEWIEGLHVETVTSFENPYININNLGAKLINGTIVSGQQYKLVYNGASFDLAEKDYVIGTYTGNSADKGAYQKIELGFTPSAVYCVSGMDYCFATADGYAGQAGVAGNVNHSCGSSYGYIEIAVDGFIAHNGVEKTSFNHSNSIATYIAFK